MNREKTKKRNGFTLVELLVTISILGVLMAIALVSFRGAQVVARDTQRKTELEEIRSALEVYRTDYGTYPETDNLESELTPDYLPTLPVDPRPADYTYDYDSAGITYTLCAHLEASTNSPTGCGGNCGSACTYQVANP